MTDVWRDLAEKIVEKVQKDYDVDVHGTEDLIEMIEPLIKAFVEERIVAIWMWKDDEK